MQDPIDRREVLSPIAGLEVIEIHFTEAQWRVMQKVADRGRSLVEVISLWAL